MKKLLIILLFVMHSLALGMESAVQMDRQKREKFDALLGKMVADLDRSIDPGLVNNLGPEDIVGVINHIRDCFNIERSSRELLSNRIDALKKAHENDIRQKQAEYEQYITGMSVSYRSQFDSLSKQIKDLEASLVRKEEDLKNKMQAAEMVGKQKDVEIESLRKELEALKEKLQQKEKHIAEIEQARQSRLSVAMQTEEDKKLSEANNRLQAKFFVKHPILGPVVVGAGSVLAAVLLKELYYGYAHSSLAVAVQGN